MGHLYNGSFIIDEQFFNDFDYSGQYNKNVIDMDKVNYSPIHDRTNYFNKKFPMLDDSVIALLAQTSLNEIEKIETTTKPPIIKKKISQKKCFTKIKDKFIIDFS